MRFEDITFVFNSDIANRYLSRLNIDEASLVYKLGLISSGDIVEIGTKYGGTSIILAAALHERKEEKFKVYSIDIINRLKTKPGIKVNKLMPKVLKEQLSFIVSPSLNIANKWKTPIGFAFFDGAHTPKALTQDLLAWTPCIINNGYVAIHDAATYKTRRQKKHLGTRRFKEICNKLLSKWKYCGQVQSILYYQRNDK